MKALQDLTTDEISELRFPLAFKNLSGVRLSEKEESDLKAYSEELQRRMEKEDQIDLALESQYRLLEKMNLALDNTIYVLAKDHPEHCQVMISEILKIVIQINRDIESIISESDRYEELSSEADLKMLEVGDTETRFFKEFANSDMALFERVNNMVEIAIDQLNLREETHYLVMASDGDVLTVKLLDVATHQGDGLQVNFVNDELDSINHFVGQEMISRIQFSKMGQSAELTFYDKKSNSVDFTAPAILLGALAAFKVGSALMKKSSHAATAVATADVGVPSVKK